MFTMGAADPYDICMLPISFFLQYMMMQHHKNGNIIYGSSI